MSKYNHDTAANVVLLFLEAGYPEHHDAVLTAVTVAGNKAYAEGYSEGRRVALNEYDYLPAFDAEVEFDVLHAEAVSDAQVALDAEAQNTVKDFLSSRWKDGRADGEHDEKHSFH